MTNVPNKKKQHVLKKYFFPSLSVYDSYPSELFSLNYKLLPRVKNMNYKWIKQNLKYYKVSYPGEHENSRKQCSESPIAIIGFLFALCALLTIMTHHLDSNRTQSLLKPDKHKSRHQLREEHLIKRHKFQLEQEAIKEQKTQDYLEGLIKHEKHACLMARPPPIPDIWVLVPGGNGVEFLPTAIESIHRQEVHVKAFYIDDHSEDGSGEVIKASLREGDELVVTDEHCGPACTKFIALDEISKLANANDVVVILDADDYFISSQASKRILEEYTGWEMKNESELVNLPWPKVEKRDHGGFF